MIRKPFRSADRTRFQPRTSRSMPHFVCVSALWPHPSSWSISTLEFYDLTRMTVTAATQFECRSEFASPQVCSRLPHHRQQQEFLDMPSLSAGYPVTQTHCEWTLGLCWDRGQRTEHMATPWLYSDVLPVRILVCELDSGGVINCHPVNKILLATLQEITFVYPPPRLLTCPPLPWSVLSGACFSFPD